MTTDLYNKEQLESILEWADKIQSKNSHKPYYIVKPSELEKTKTKSKTNPKMQIKFIPMDKDAQITGCTTSEGGE